ncbi:hypothetical protein C8R44DRAFT_820552, partial [Mycena epipterygia]
MGLSCLRSCWTHPHASGPIGAGAAGSTAVGANMDGSHFHFVCFCWVWTRFFTVRYHICLFLSLFFLQPNFILPISFSRSLVHCYACVEYSDINGPML